MTASPHLDVHLPLGFPARKVDAIHFVDATLDMNALRLSGRTGQVGLSVREYKLLLALLQNPGWRLSRRAAASAVWEHRGGYEGSDTYRKYGQRLSRALADVGSSLVIVMRSDWFFLVHRHM